MMETRSGPRKRPANSDLPAPAAKAPRTQAKTPVAKGKQAKQATTAGRYDDDDAIQTKKLPAGRREGMSGPALSTPADTSTHEDSPAAEQIDSNARDSQEANNGNGKGQQPKSAGTAGMDQAPSQPDNEKETQQGQASEKPSGEKDNAEDVEKRGDDGGGDRDDRPADDGKSEEARQDKEQRSIAIDTLLQLSIVLERRRVLPAGGTILEDMPKGVKRLCELTANTALARNNHLKMLPFNFWWEMEDIKRAVAEVEVEQERVKTAHEELTRCRKEHHDALVQRSLEMLGLRESSPESMETHNAAVLTALEALGKAREAHDTLKADLAMSFKEFEDSLRLPLGGCEHGLIHAGLLNPAAETLHEEAPMRQSVAENETAVSAGSRPVNAQSDAQLKTGSANGRHAIEERRQGNHHPQQQAYQYPPDRASCRRASSAPGHSRHATRSRRPDPEVENTIQIVQQTTLTALENARKTYNTSRQNFDDVRNGYHRDLHDYLADQRAGRYQGTRTHFDQSYYLARGRANHALAQADDAWAFALEQAERTDALTRKQRVNFLGDWDESDHESGWFVRDLIWEEKEREVWRWLEGIEEQVDPGAVGVPAAPRHEGKEVAEIEELQMKSTLATGAMRRLIDGWQLEMGRMREAVRKEMGQDDGEGREQLPWWQVWDGI